MKTESDNTLRQDLLQAFAIGGISVGKGAPLLLISGPCVIEDEQLTLEIAASLKEAALRRGLGFIFKASFDKANRTSVSAYRGPGMVKGLDILAKVKEKLDVLVLSDIHTPDQAKPASEVLDVLQVPAFLCRQTDLLLAAGNTGKPVNVKKGQFMAPWDMSHVVTKLLSTGNKKIFITERGFSFGYNNLVVDFRGLALMRKNGWPVVFDATHSVQMPGGQGSCSSGDRELAPVLARAAVAVGVDGLFFEVHPSPDKAMCDGPNSLRLGDVPRILDQLLAIRLAAANFEMDQ